jgi:hypothetical protein
MVINNTSPATKGDETMTEFANKQSLIKAYALHLLTEMVGHYGAHDTNHCDYGVAELTAKQVTVYTPGLGWNIKDFGFTKARA